MLLQHHGRIKLKTDVDEITKENVIHVLRKAYGLHLVNVSDIKSLISYDAGDQPLIREKKVRSDIDCQLQDNLAHYIVERHLSYDWGCPITITQRGEKDSGKSDEVTAISLYNELASVDGNESKIQEMARYVEICGLGYTFSQTVKKKDYDYYENYFTSISLHPANAFVIYDHTGNRPVLGVTFRHDGETGNNYFTCFTENKRFEIVNLQEIVNGELSDDDRWYHTGRSGEKNPIGRIPIVEWIRSHDRTGAFEHVIPMLDELNLLVSDYANSVETNIQSIWHTNDVDFQTDENGNVKRPEANTWLQTYTARDGKTPVIEALTMDYDYSGQLENINATRSKILEECDIPNRDTTSGGSTGVGAGIITGYEAADEAANKKQLIIKDCAMKKLDVDLACIRSSLIIEQDNPLLALRKRDCDISIKRDKNRELTTKINFFATAISHGIHGLHAITAANIWGDPNQVWEDSQETIEKYQESIFNKQNDAEGGNNEKKPDAEKIEQDISDQITNSPNIDGKTTGQEV